jgi:DNA-binding beta-propeller fold protein YncE
MPVPACATCDAEARLAILDAAGGRVVRYVPCLDDPRSIELVGGRFAVVCHTAVGAVSIFDGRTLSMRHVLRGFGEPRYVAAHPNGRIAYVTDSGRVEVSAIDVVRGERIGHLKLREWPRHVTMHPRGTALWVGLGSVSEHVAVVDIADRGLPRLTDLVRPPFGAHDVGYGVGGQRILVTAGASPELAVYDTAGRVTRRLRADAAPQHVTFAGNRVFVTSGASGTLRVLDSGALRELAATRIPIGSYNVQAGHGLVLTPSLDDGTVTILDQAGAVLHRVHVGSSSHDASFLS